MDCGDGFGQHVYIHPRDDENETYIKEAVYACYNQRRGCPCGGVAVNRKPDMQGSSLYQPPDQGKGQAGHGEAGL